MTNWYQVLGISRQATEEEMKSAYRKLAKKYHPDAHPGDQECEQKFREISEAYSILSDIDKRKKYDEELNGAGKGQKAAERNEQPKAQENGKVDFENIHRNFEQFFGFNPNTKDIIHEDKLKPREPNPLDATAFFEQFMGIKR